MAFSTPANVVGLPEMTLLSALAAAEGWLKVTVLFSPMLKLFHSMIAWSDCCWIVSVWSSVVSETSPDIVVLPLGNSANKWSE